MSGWTFVGTTKELRKELKRWPLTLSLEVYLNIIRHGKLSHYPSAPTESNAPPI